MFGLVGLDLELLEPGLELLEVVELQVQMLGLAELGLESLEVLVVAVVLVDL